VGRELGLSGELLDRHPFPGPGLAIRCLCSEFDAPVLATGEGFIVPVNTVGVQGDSRTYAPVLAIDTLDPARATDLINCHCGREPRDRASGDTRPGWRNAGARLFFDGGSAEAPAQGGCAGTPFDPRERLRSQGWQFPVILIPLGTADAPDSVVLRPVDSVDGMTAQSMLMDAPLLHAICAEVLQVEGIAGVFYDLTHKPPGTIEWSSGRNYFAGGSLKSIPNSLFRRSVSSRSTRETDAWL